ncbi:DUF488 family protein [Vulgatibacter incomptus]|uniref:Eukaryotic putative RNA-binding region RNP-1 signature n=1 Tax=Vulgatibacter incomptus TaxID=1391653 RepID=A0A0K1PIM6_9BACT|nr:DUF488 domain-containing protein [Vulgatibacter incomptus]AKU93241.1 eukaryotic putative RNA-binding region RNP-1 signature [Vulgatibacter incomptus]
MPSNDTDWSGLEVYTIGHSTRSQDELVELLDSAGVTLLADVRSYPRSRHNPQFNRDVLEELLPSMGIRYIHLASLGGRRKGLGDESPNDAWRSLAFRGFADYMLDPGFEEGLEELHELASRARVAIMCAEAVPWRCHRSLVSDALVVRGARVFHIVGDERVLPHELTSFARVDGDRITYPSEEDEDAGRHAGAEASV